MQSGFSPGSLVRARGRDWIVLPGREASILHLRPLTRGQADEIGIYLPLEGRQITSAEFVPPAAGRPGEGDDLRRDPLDVRKATLASVVAKGGPNEHIEGDGEAIFRHACKLRLEGIVSKRKDSPYRSGRSPDWLKFKNPAAPAVKREAEEDWSKEKWR